MNDECLHIAQPERPGFWCTLKLMVQTDQHAVPLCYQHRIVYCRCWETCSRISNIEIIGMYRTAIRMPKKKKPPVPTNVSQSQMVA